MKEECLQMQELLPDYINGHLDKDQAGLLLVHLAVCPACRRELAQELALQRELKAILSPIPREIKQAAFALVQEELPKEAPEELTVAQALDYLCLALLPVSKSLKLAFKLI